MWSVLGTIVFLARSTFTLTSNDSFIFNPQQVIYTSTYNITNILVPADGSKYIQPESFELPSIFFTVTDPHLNGGSCIYVLEDLTAYAILEGGRDSTTDYSNDGTIYFGAYDGVYKYDRDSLSAIKVGPYKDNIIQLQKANGTDKIYYLTMEHKIYKIEENGTVRTKIQGVCATQFVLDTSNNIYYVQCGNQMIHIIKEEDLMPKISDLFDEFLDVKLVRPAFIMQDCIPLFGDGILHILYSNGTCEKKDFYIPEKPSAFSVDAALYLVAALDGKIYEYNVMEVLLKTIFGLGTQLTRDINYNVIMSIIGHSKENLFEIYKGWYKNK